MRFLIDHYVWICGVISLGVAGWTAIISFILGIGLIVRFILSEKQ
jgi:hypothetical protein